MSNPGENIRMTAYASLMAALIAAGAYISIPAGPVPIVLQNLFIYLTGILLGPRWGTMTVGIYLLAGALGLPVFAGGAGGIARFLGPTGGYLIGFLFAVLVVGYVAFKKPGSAMYQVTGMILGTILIYAPGLLWLKISLGISLKKAAVLGMYPFLIGDALKIAAAVPIARSLLPIVRKKSAL